MNMNVVWRDSQCVEWVGGGRARQKKKVYGRPRKNEQQHDPRKKSASTQTTAPAPPQPHAPAPTDTARQVVHDLLPQLRQVHVPATCSTADLMSGRVIGWPVPSPESTGAIRVSRCRLLFAHWTALGGLGLPPKSASVATENSVPAGGAHAGSSLFGGANHERAQCRRESLISLTATKHAALFYRG